MAGFQYVIVGNSAAGVSAIEAIRALDPRGTIACISDETFPAYSTPMISYLLKGATNLGKMSIRPKGFYERNAVACLFGSPVVALDARKSTVTLADGTTVGYGSLLWAAGSVPSDPPVPGLAGGNVFTFLKLSDALAIQACIDALRAADPAAPVRVAVIGSGLIGTKACEGLVHAADEVTMLARSGSILRSVLDPAASPLVEQVLEDGGVDVRLSTVATSAVAEDGRVTALELDDGSTLSVDLVVCAAGVKPNVAVPQDAGARVDRGLVCDEHMLTSLPQVYAAGDAAVSHDPLDDRDKVIALWPDAVEQGAVAGNAMAGGSATYQGGFALNAIGFFGRVSILSAGVSVPRDEAFESHVHAGDGWWTRFVTKGDRLCGFTLVNRPEAAGIYTRLIRDEVPLSSVDDALFERAPQMRDLPYTLRWPSMHKGFPVGKEA